MIGQRFGSSTVVAITQMGKLGKVPRRVIARCDCGTEREMSVGNLRFGTKNRCPECYRRDRLPIKHVEARPGQTVIVRESGNYMGAIVVPDRKVAGA